MPDMTKVITKATKLATAGATISVIPLIIPKQDLYEGAGASQKVPAILRKAGAEKPLIVTDKVLIKLGVLQPMLDSMTANGMQYAIYDGVEPNPAIENIEDAYTLYKANACDSIVGFGGGSAMDAAKVLSGRVVKPNMSVKQMGRLMGYMPISIPFFKPTPYVVAVPTTAGTGAESTIAAVVSDHAEDKKYTITDPLIRPNVTVLDPALAVGLPAYPTACTAIDAMSHCIEGYIGMAHNARSDEFAERGVRMIFENIDLAIKDGHNLEARQNLCLAAYYGGQSLNTATTGYVHPFCHKIGAKYGLVHGRCIGAVLPIILDVYGDKAAKRLAKLGVAAGICDPKATTDVQAKQFIGYIRDFDAKYGIQANIPEIDEADFEEIAASIIAENFVYPTPVVFDKEEIFAILRKIKG